MKTRGVASLAFKILGVFFVAQAVTLFGALPFSLKSGYFGTLLGSFLLTLLAGFGLVFLSRSLGRRLVPDSENEEFSTSLSVSDWQSIAFSAMGVIFFVAALRDFAGLYRPMTSRFELTLPSLLPSIVQLVLGLGLFFQARGLANVWRRLQESRTVRKEEG